MFHHGAHVAVGYLVRRMKQLLKRLLRPFLRPILNRFDDLARRDEALAEQVGTLAGHITALESHSGAPEAAEEAGEAWTLAGDIRNRSGGIVFSGPFSGLVLSDEVSWGSAESQVPLLVGCYEQELHEAVEELVAREPRQIVNIGCGEGYYAVGVARRLASAIVTAVDLDPRALEICTATASANGVADRVRSMTPSVFGDTEFPPSDTAWIVDCEGYELTYLDPVRRPDLAQSMIIVECHDFVDRSITPELIERFSTTHSIELLEQGGRNPNACALLRHLPDIYRWQAVDEGRPEIMHWLVLRPHTP